MWKNALKISKNQKQSNSLILFTNSLKPNAIQFTFIYNKQNYKKNNVLSK